MALTVETLKQWRWAGAVLVTHVGQYHNNLGKGAANLHTHTHHTQAHTPVTKLVPHLLHPTLLLSSRTTTAFESGLQVPSPTPLLVLKSTNSFQVPLPLHNFKTTLQIVLISTNTSSQNMHKALANMLQSNENSDECNNNVNV